MAESTLIQEFHSDHVQVVQALLNLRRSIQARDLVSVRATLDGANRLVGPHFKFEELHLYPKLREFVGEGGMHRLLMEHDGVFRGVAALVNLASKDSWTDAEVESAAAYLDLIREHPISCDGLSLYIERLPTDMQTALLNEMNAMRRQGTTLLDYRTERN